MFGLAKTTYRRRARYSSTDWRRFGAPDLG